MIKKKVETPTRQIQMKVKKQRPKELKTNIYTINRLQATFLNIFFKSDKN